LLHAENLASIGFLVAGVAHEINNPIGFVSSNLGTLDGYTKVLLDIALEFESWLAAGAPQGSALKELKLRLDTTDLHFMRDDLFSLIKESRDGLERVSKIVADLRSFARHDSTELELADINTGLESSLNIVSNELQHKAKVVRDFGQLPPVRCNLGNINRVFMNLLVNAAHSMGEQGIITITTRHEGDWVTVAVADTGSGIPAESLHRIFDPFYTTKPVGKGKGLGLSLSWGIARNHGGRLEVISNPGAGSTFTLYLPVAGPDPASSLQL
jgi:signal transduction histidine kinase